MTHGDCLTGELQNVHFDLDTNCWMYGVDMSCLAIYDNGPMENWRHSLTAITPQHVISATHVSPDNGLQVSFQSLSGEVVVRTLVAQTFIPNVAENDLWIGLLDSPLPPCIKPAKFLSPDYVRYIGTGRKLPLVRIGNNKSCNIHDIIYLAPTDRHQRMCCLHYSAAAIRHRYMRAAWGMDSGHPLFLLFGDDLTFVCPARGYYYSEGQATGYLCAYYMILIRQALNGLNVQFGIDPTMTIDEFDLSVYGGTQSGGGL